MNFLETAWRELSEEYPDVLQRPLAKCVEAAKPNNTILDLPAFTRTFGQRFLKGENANKQEVEIRYGQQGAIPLSVHGAANGDTQVVKFYWLQLALGDKEMYPAVCTRPLFIQ